MSKLRRTCAKGVGLFKFGLLASALLSCALYQLPAIAAPKQATTLAEIVSSLGAEPQKGNETESLTRATAAMKFIVNLKLPQASKAINEALQLDARNSYLHFFNGFIYHLQARQGDTDKTDMAIEGYQQATRFDPGNWIAHEFLGLALLEQRQYAKAQRAFAEVLLLRPGEPVTLFRMMAASYMAGDAKMACAMADQLDSLPQERTEGFLRTSVTVYASCGDFDKAERMRQTYSEQGVNRVDADRTDQRLSQWKSFFKYRNERSGSGKPDTQGGYQKTQWGEPAPAAPGGIAPATPTTSATASVPATGGESSRMVLVDVVMVRTEDSISTTKGVNLLSALTIQFGSTPAGGTALAAYNQIYNSATAATEAATVVTRAITIPALAYSLNLANANSSINEVLARPTLAAVEGMRSEFFSGTNLNAAVVSSGGTAGAGGAAVSVEKRFGVKLAVVPQILPNGMIKLAIDASRTFLKPPMPYPGFTYKLEISEILANANVVMRMGDTLVLGGLSEKESTNNRDGVPFLQDIPGLQYFFSQQSKTEFQRSVLILITPRPASYTWLSDETKAANAQSGTEASITSIDVLQARYGDWFKPYPNLTSVFHHLNSTELYREFRTSDVELERWDRMQNTSERLRQALDFLYY